MSTRVTRRERRIRLYYLTHVIERMRQSAQAPGEPPIELDLPAMFGVSAPIFDAWLQQRIPIPVWVQQLGEKAYQVPAPPWSYARRWILPLLVAVVVAGMIGVVLLARR